MHLLRGNSASENLPCKAQRPKCSLYKMPYYVAAPVRETGDVFTRTPLYARLPTYAPTKTIFFLFTSNVFLQRLVSSKYWLFRLFSTRKPHVKVVPSKDYFMHLRTLKNTRNKKGTLSNWPRLLPISSTALLSHWGQQSLKDMMSLRTDFETHAIWQGYIEDTAGKDFVARKARTIALSKA